MHGYVDEEGYYHPHPDEALPSPVPGMSRGEFERIAERILWFSALPLADRLTSLEDQEEQRVFERLRVVRHGS